MKYLKLDAQFEGARKLAECLIGSECDYSWEIEGKRTRLIGVDKHDFIVRLHPYNIYHTIKGEEEIPLVLDTLKLCPFMAMKNGIKVKAKCMRRDKGYQGFLGRSALIDGAIYFNLTDKDGDLITEFGVCQISLDLEKLPEGVEVVEL
jgi:hypothetical protein